MSDFQTCDTTGFIIHAWMKGEALRLCGRTADGRSFALSLSPRERREHLEARRKSLQDLRGPDGTTTSGMSASVASASAPGEPVTTGTFPVASQSDPLALADRSPAIPAPAPAFREDPWSAFAPPGPPGFRPEDEFLLRMGIRGAVRIEGRAKPGRQVDLAFSPARLSPTLMTPAARWLALDIETGRDGSVRAVSLVSTVSPPGGAESGLVHLLVPPLPGEAAEVRSLLPDSPTPPSPCGPSGPSDPSGPSGSFALPGPASPVAPGSLTDLPSFPDWIVPHKDEAGLLASVCTDIRRLDPDTITGWNVAEFDFGVLAKRCAELGVPFLAGRVMDEEVQTRTAASGLLRVTVPGRQVLDALRVVRSSGERYPDHRLQTVARAVLGTGKTVELEGEEKLAELDRLWLYEPEAFCAYCREDSRLVLAILQKTGLDRLSLERAALTGTSLDLAWTSIPAFERIYALELWQRNIEPPGPNNQSVSGAAGGTVLDPESGMFDHVWVFDFKSLYPTIMRTFNIDPLTWARALRRPADSRDITAPNGARFDRRPGILPDLVGSYFDQRMAAQARGDETGAYVYKILMNSFYGVLGSAGCRYGRTALAGAITSFGRHFLLASRDFFQARGFEVLYGDTDSVFVHACRDDPQLASDLARELNAELAGKIKESWDCKSWLQIRFEKAYRVFMIPRLRSGGLASRGSSALPDPDGAGQTARDSADPDRAEPDEPVMNSGRVRGRAKGYAGLCTDGSIEIKGMEAARSDYTPLAVRFQQELLARLFSHQRAQEVAAWVRDFVDRLYRGELDAELVYRKMLRRPAKAYTANEPPQVKVARELGWTDRRGRVEYLMTAEGPRALALCREKPDYRHYVEHQLRPIWESLADAADRGDGKDGDQPGESGGLMAARPLDRDPGQGELF